MNEKRYAETEDSKGVKQVDRLNDEQTDHHVRCKITYPLTNLLLKSRFKNTSIVAGNLSPLIRTEFRCHYFVVAFYSIFHILCWSSYTVRSLFFVH